jgi:hypothetical protein
MSRLFALIVLCSIAFFNAHIGAQATATPAQAILITISPGEAAWEKYGHNMLWLRDPSTGFDACYNWGLFDFDQPGFIKNFIQGRMKYTMDAFAPEDALGVYARQKRAVRLQRLELSQPQVLKLIELCENNRRPENADYLYDYYKDNCSTRVRDMIAAVQHDPDVFKRTLQQTPGSGQTYRQHSLRLMQNNALLCVGLDFTLGPACDVPLSKWDEAFLPGYLAQAIAADAEELKQPWLASPVEHPTAAPVWWPWSLLAGVCVAGAMLLISGWRCGGLIALTLWWGTGSIASLFLIFMWALTDHRAAHANQNLMLFTPLMIIGLVMLYYNPWRHKSYYIACACIAFALFHIILKFLGILTQSTAFFTAFVLPLHIAAGVICLSMRVRKTM